MVPDSPASSYTLLENVLKLLDWGALKSLSLSSIKVMSLVSGIA